MLIILSPQLFLSKTNVVVCKKIALISHARKIKRGLFLRQRPVLNIAETIFCWKKIILDSPAILVLSRIDECRLVNIFQQKYNILNDTETIVQDQLYLSMCEENCACVSEFKLYVALN